MYRVEWVGEELEVVGDIFINRPSAPLSFRLSRRE
jgi:hypothetical protein